MRCRPLKRPVQGMLKLSQFTWEFPVLFDGRDVPANALPWNYVPQWALITIPPPQMVANMKVDKMDGFCVGEP